MDEPAIAGHGPSVFRRRRCAPGTGDSRPFCWPAALAEAPARMEQTLAAICELQVVWRLPRRGVCELGF